MDTQGLRHWCESVDNQFHPRLTADIPRGQDQKQIPEAFLAYAIKLIRACADELDKPRVVVADHVDTVNM